MNAVIIPAILPASRQDLENKLLALQGVAKNVQVDIVDGEFVSPASWPYLGNDAAAAEREDVAGTMEYIGGLHLEMDLMVAQPETELNRWINAGANRVVVHAESTHRLPKLIDDFKTTYGHDKDFAPGLLSLGLGINISTEIALIEPFLNRCDYVQFMGIAHIGKQGEPFDRSVLAKIGAFRKKYPSMPIQVDGGVSLETAPGLLSAGVSRLIVGSALWKAPNLAVAYKQFLDLTTRYGTYT